MFGSCFLDKSLSPVRGKQAVSPVAGVIAVIHLGALPTR